MTKMLNAVCTQTHVTFRKTIRHYVQHGSKSCWSTTMIGVLNTVCTQKCVVETAWPKPNCCRPASMRVLSSLKIEYRNYLRNGSFLRKGQGPHRMHTSPGATHIRTGEPHEQSRRQDALTSKYTNHAQHTGGRYCGGCGFRYFCMLILCSTTNQTPIYSNLPLLYSILVVLLKLQLLAQA